MKAGDGEGEIACWPSTETAGVDACTVSSAILSSMFIWSWLPVAEPNGKTELALPKTGCDEGNDDKEAVPADGLNENMLADEALVEEPKTIGALLLPATEAEDPPKGNPVDVEPNMGDLVVGQLELNTLEVMPLVELREVLASDNETEELSPLLLDPNSLAGVEEPNRELRGAAPVIPNGDEVDKPNWMGMLWVEDAIPVPAGDDDVWAESKDPLPAPKGVGPRDWLLAVEEEDEPLNPKMPLPVLAILEDVPPRDWLLAFEEVEPLNPKMLFPVFAVAGDVPPKGALVGLPKVVSCLVLASLSVDSTPEVVRTGETEVNGATEVPNVKMGAAENEGTAADIERLLLGLVVAAVAEVEAFAAVAALGVKLLETLWFEILEPRSWLGEVNIEQPEASNPLFRLESLAGAPKEKMPVVDVEADTADENAVSGFFNESPAFCMLLVSPWDDSGIFRTVSVAPAETEAKLHKYMKEKLKSVKFPPLHQTKYVHKN